MRNFTEGRSCHQHKLVEWQFCSVYSLNTSHSPNHWRRDVAIVQSLSCVQLFATPWTAACQTSLSFTISWSLFKLMSIKSVILSNLLILCHPLLVLLPSMFPSIRVFSNESALCIKLSKYWSFSFSISPSNEYSGLISFSSDWFDLLADQRTLKSLRFLISFELIFVYGLS